MKQSKLSSVVLTAAIVFELGGDYQKVFRKEADKEAGTAKRDLIYMSMSSKEQMEDLSRLLIQQRVNYA